MTIETHKVVLTITFDAISKPSNDRVQLRYSFDDVFEAEMFVDLMTNEATFSYKNVESFYEAVKNEVVPHDAFRALEDAAEFLTSF